MLTYPWLHDLRVLPWLGRPLSYQDPRITNAWKCLATSGTLATQQPIPRTARYSAMTIPQWVRYVAWTNALGAHFEFNSCLFCISLHGDQQHVLKRIPLMQRWRLSLRTADRDWDPIGTPAFDTTNCGMTDTRQPLDMELSWNRGTPTSSMFMAFSIIKPPFWGLYHHLWTPPYHGLLLKISSLSWWSPKDGHWYVDF